MSLNSDEASLPGGVVSLPSREFFPLPRLGISATLPEEIVTASFEEVALQDNVDSPQDSSHHLCFQIYD